MSIFSPERVAQREHNLSGSVEPVTDAASRIQLAAVADPDVIESLILGGVVWKHAGRPPEAVMGVHSGGGALKNQPAREQVTDLKFAVAHLGRNLYELLPNAEAIAPLDKCSGQDRIQAAG